jgi:hypothetical protein
MSPLMVAQYIVISLRFECRVLVMAAESMVAKAMTFLCSSGAYTTLSCLILFQKRQELSPCARGEHLHDALGHHSIVLGGSLIASSSPSF